MITEKKTILDCAAGTGIYSFHFADKGHIVTATDITPRHIEVIQTILRDKPYKMKTAKKIDQWSDKEFKIWCDYHYSICRERSILGASNHVIIIGRK